MVHLYNADSTLLRHEPGSVDLVVTSPPYKDEDGYKDTLIKHTFRNVHEAMRDGALCFVNFGHLAGYKSRPFRVVEILEEQFGELRETFIWVKNHYRPIQGKRRVNNLFEYVFMFCKGNMPELDRLAVGVPYADKSNIGRYSDRDLKCGGNVWYIDYETVTASEQKLHNDRYPVALPRRCIDLSGLAIGSTVMDPFMGSGTTGVAAQQSGMNFVGVELDKHHYDVASKRIQEYAS